MSDLGGYTIRRSYINPDVTKDRYDIHPPEGLPINVSYKTACEIMTGQLTPAALWQQYAKKETAFLL